MIKSIAHVCLISENLKAAERFYREILGLEIKFLFKKGPETIGMYFRVNGSNFIEIFKADTVNTDSKNVMRHLCLETGDMDALRKKLADNGFAPGEKKLGGDNSWQFWVKGPDQVDIEFHEYTKDSSQFTGKDCIVDW